MPRGSDRLRHVTVVLPLLAAVLLVSFGTGYRTTRVAQHDGSAWLIKGRTAAHVNGETGRTDAEVAKDLATGRQRLEVVQTPSGEVYVVNNDTGTVSRIDTTTMAPAATRPNPKSGGAVQVLSGGGSTYVVDRRHRQVHLVDPETLATRRTVGVPGSIDGAAVDGQGTCWVLDGRRGRVRRISDGRQAGEVEVGQGRDQRLTLVGDRPVVVAPSRGEVVRVDQAGSGAAPAARVPIPEGEPLAVSAPAASGSTAWLALPRSGELVGADLGSGRSRSARLGVGEGTQLGPPVEASGRVYVPDYSHHVVLVVDAASLRLLDRVEVPGTSREFEVFVRNGKVWVNDPFAQKGKVIGPDGRARDIDKGPGRGVGGERPPAGSVPPADRPEGPRGPSGSVPAPAGPGGPDRQPGPTRSGGGTTTTGPPASTAERLVAVPDVVGRDRVQACDTLRADRLNCRLEEVAPGPSAQGRPGEVLATDPAAGTRVRPGRLVLVRHLGSSDPPPVVGRPVAEACRAVTDAGLVCRQNDLGVAPAGQQSGVVLAQRPDRGPVLRGSEVAVDFYGEHMRTVPPLVGKSPDQACAELAAVQLGCERQAADGPARPNVIHGQDPPEGTAVVPGTTVRIAFDDTPTTVIQTFKRNGLDIRVLTSDEAHAASLAGSGNYGPPSVLGRAYHPSTPASDWLMPLYAHERDDGRSVPNRYYSPNPSEPGWRTEGVAAVIFRNEAPGTIAMYRMVRTQNGHTDYGYAVDGEIRRVYVEAGYVVDGTLGYIWPN